MSSNLKVFNLPDSLIRENVTKILPNASDFVESVMWVYSENMPYFTANDVSTIVSVLGKFRPVLWSSGLGRGNSVKLQDHHRVFKSESKQDLHYIQQVDIKASNMQRKLYSDVIRVNPDLYPYIAGKLSATSPGIHIAMSFLPDKTEDELKWANMTIGLLWRSIVVIDIRERTKYHNYVTQNVISDYIRSTLALNGVATVSIYDFDTKPSLLIFGSQKSMEDALDNFYDRFEVMSESQGTTLLLRSHLSLMGTR